MAMLLFWCWWCINNSFVDATSEFDIGILELAEVAWIVIDDGGDATRLLVVIKLLLLLLMISWLVEATTEDLILVRW